MAQNGLRIDATLGFAMSASLSSHDLGSQPLDGSMGATRGPFSVRSFALEVECEFAAAHAIVLGGVRERLHGHNWRVVVSVAGAQLDHEELLCDFHLVEALLRDIVSPFRDGNLNETAPFDQVNPTAEAVARHVATALAAALEQRAPAVRLEWVRVTEAPRCTAVVRLS